MKARHLTAIAALCSPLLCQGCVSMKDTMKEIYQQGIAKTRRPGQQMVEAPDVTMKRLCCPPYQRNVIYLEEAGTLPERVGPGEELNHRIRYAYSPTTRGKTFHARLVRRVFYRDREVFRDIGTQEFCAGTWTVDAFIKVPRNAPSGWYSVRLEIISQGRTISRSSVFFVKERRKPAGPVTSAIGSTTSTN